MTHTSPLPVFLAVSALADHPLLAHIPMWSREEPEFQALLDSIRDRGLDYPVLIDAEHRIVDGRNRRNALALLGRPVECRVIDAGESASVVIASLCNRRHLSKGALAYLSAPLFEDVLSEAKERNFAMLKAGGESVAHSVRHAPKNTQEVADLVGVGARLFDQALDLHRRFTKNPAQRAEFEPKILSGELGLGGCIQAIAGQDSTKGKEKKERGLDRLFSRAFKDLNVRFGKWGKLAEEQRAEVTVALVKTTDKWPDEVVTATAAEWRKAGRI
jgi:hypothetical protein